jgi:[acyl-carrier-protein] S-malonyltransferase
MLQSMADAGSKFNSPGQIIIQVQWKASAVQWYLQRRGAKWQRLVVHGAFHSPLMESAKEDFEVALDYTEFKKVQIPVYTNVHAKPITKDTELEFIKRSLYDQLTSSVRWDESVMNMINDGAREFIELGPGKVLQGLIKRIDSTVTIKGVDKAEDITKL